MHNKEAEQFEYNDQWFRYGFIDSTFVQRQAKVFAESTSDDIEEFKWAAYSLVLSRESFDTEERKKEFLDLIEHDPNEHIWKGAISILIDRGDFDESWRKISPNSRVFAWSLLDGKMRHKKLKNDQ